MAEDAVEVVNGSPETPHRHVQYGKVYDHLEPGQRINIAALGNIFIEIDEENLDLGRISPENLNKGWERDSGWFTQRCKDLGLGVDPYEVYKYYQIQRKTFQVLGKPAENVGMRRKTQLEKNDQVKLSETKGHAMCSEYAILSAYIAQKIGERIHLVIGSAVQTSDEDQWREAHAYVWVDGLNMVLDSVLARQDNEFPALMVPNVASTLSVLEEGHDIEATRVGSIFTRYYGLEAGGFGVNTGTEVP